MKKKKLKATITLIMLSLVILFSNTFVIFAGTNAIPSHSKVLINGNAYNFDAYLINGSNYFKLYDLATALNGDSKGFDIFLDESENTINILKNKPYSGINKEIKLDDGTVKNAEQLSYKIYIDGKEAAFSAYSIGAETYFKLQDIMSVLNINVAWNNKNKVIVINSSMAYTDAPKPLSGFIICVDPGHGENNSHEKEAIAPNSNVLKPAFVSGASGSLYSESQVNLSVGLILRDKLEAQGATVIMTREGEDATLSNIGRAKLGNDAGANLAVHIHCDGSTSEQASGISVLVQGKQYSNENLVNSSYKIGEAILNKVIEKTGDKSKGVTTRNDLTGFNWSTIPSVLIEMGFMTNQQEDILLETPEYQNKIAEGITDAIVEIYKTEINTIAAPEPEPVKITEAERIFNKRVNAYMKQNPGLSLEDATWKVKIDLDKIEFTQANLLTKEQLQSISVIVNKRNRVPDDYVPNDLVKITDRVSLRSEAKTAYDKMVSDANIEGFHIFPISGFRTVAYQQNLYNRYLKSDSFANVETYSARAGFSEHHTGLAIDVAGPNRNMSSFVKTKEHTWVAENGHKYGFIIRYFEDETYITGYKNEPWHLRYVGIEAATQMKNKNIKTFEEYAGKYIL